MSKLTEIKEALKIREELRRCDQDTLWMCYLLSLLEEKDKALEQLADDKNYLLVCDTEDVPWKYVWFGDEDQREIARKALNTSSNNEGEL